MIKAIFLDMDGTLMSHRLGDIPPSALRALGQLRDKGILIFLATGRHKLELDRLPLHGFPFDGYVTVTGQIVCDGQWRVLYKSPLPEKDSAVLARAFRDHRLPLMMIHENDIYINYVDDMVRRLLDAVSTPLPPIRPFLEEPIYTVVTFCPQEQMRQLSLALPGCRFSAWHPNGFDIVSRKESKTHGIQEMLGHFGLQPQEVAAFGDGDNDVDMLSFAGIGVAMGNGSKKAKASADYITGDIDADGLADAFRKLKLLD